MKKPGNNKGKTYRRNHAAITSKRFQIYDDFCELVGSGVKSKDARNILAGKYFTTYVYICFIIKCVKDGRDPNEQNKKAKKKAKKRKKHGLNTLRKVRKED